ncbi:MAG: GNAT family N-acetyltransferase [Planctomycetes bacterium]|nr:GNAT family N-acetyltransferase [Planctomycetota bacterium]
MSEAFAIRAAAPDDVAHIARFIRELAAYERLEHELAIDEKALAMHLFGPTPCCGALLAECDGAPVGFALHFTSYSTFLTSPCLHLEDLYVEPAQRGKGVGLALLRATAAVAVARGCQRLDWAVLDWNTPAIGFYERQGARVLPDWRVCRVDGEALAAMAAAGR